MSPYLRMALCGIGAGLASALLWAGVSYLTGRELGWIAWGVGLIIGLGVRFSNSETSGWGPGILAAVLVIPALVGGKYLAVRFVVAREFAKLSIPVSLGPDEIKMGLANEVVSEYQAQKKRLDWPKKNRLVTSATESPQLPSEFPPDVWKEASRRWDQLTPAEREQRQSAANKSLRESVDRIRKQVIDRAFESSFSPFDILWFLLAIATAFRVGSQLVTQDD